MEFIVSLTVALAQQGKAIKTISKIAKRLSTPNGHF